MVDIVVFALERPEHPDEETEARRLKRGDVLAVGDDGHDFGSDIVDLPMFRVVRVPDGHKARLRALMSGDLFDPERVDQILRKRRKRIDLDAIEAEERTRLGRELGHKDRVTTTQVRVDALTRSHRAVRNRRVFGRSARVIG